MILLNLLALAAADPIGIGSGLDCDFDQFISEIECSLAQGFNVSFSVAFSPKWTEPSQWSTEVLWDPLGFTRLGLD